MKILHIITDTNIGGAGRLLLAFLREYDRNTFNIEVVAPVGSLLTQEIAALGVECTELPHIAEKSFSLKGLRAINKLLWKKNPDIVHTHASLAGRIAAKMWGCAIVHSRHYCVYPPKVGDTRFPVRQALGFVNHFFSDAVIATSPEVKKGLVETGTRAKHISVICNGVPPVRVCSNEEKLDIRARYGIKPEAFIVAQIARFSEVKGHKYTLDAAKILAQDPSIVVLLAGNGSEKDPENSEAYIRQRVKDEAIGNVCMTGFIHDIDEIINITDVQVNSSFTETTCLSLLEGMSLGIPAVATDAGGNPITITSGKNGLIVPVENAKAMAEAVVKIKSDPVLYRELSEGAKDEYHANFHASKMARDIEALYRRVRVAK